MFNLATACLVLWVPVVYFVFEKWPVQKAVVFSFVSAWLFLPTAVIPLPGFPDWGKVTATVVSVLMCTGAKRVSGYLRLKLSWFDLPVIVFCLGPFASSVTADQGAYDGASAVLVEIFRWGFPYLIGRAFLGDALGNRLLCYGIAIGGIAYIPICLIEIRMGPVLRGLVYSMPTNITAFGLRYGGYRPVGFLETGLELGWWMCCATLAAYMLWKSGAVKQVQGYPLGPILLFLALVTLGCKSTGAIAQLALGFAVVHLAKWMKSPLALWFLVMIPPTYCIARPTGVWSGETLVNFANNYLGDERAQSIAFRFEQEEYLMRDALRKPIFGFARTGGFNPPDKSGMHSRIADGYWIIVLGTQGTVGLSSLIAMFLVPTILFARKVKVEHWFHPDIAPVTTLALILPLFMIDSLSNAMLNPIYALAMGSVSGYMANYSARDLGAGLTRGKEPGPPAAGTPRPIEAGASGHDGVMAQAFDAFDGRCYPEAIRLLDDELDELHHAFRRRPTADLLVQIGRAHALRARCYARLHEAERSIEEREYLLGLWSQYAALLDGDPIDYPEFADNLNDLAWSLLASRAKDLESVERALAHAARVVEAHPGVGAYWNTLGVARYRVGDYLAAIKALSNSINLSHGHGSLYDFYYLALANHRLGYRKPAEAWLSRAESAQPSDDLDDPWLESLRNEAADAISA